MLNNFSIDKTKERKDILKRVFPRTTLFEIGYSLEIPLFEKSLNGWDLEENKASLEIALQVTTDDKFKKIFEEFKPRRWKSFRGRYYTFDKGEFLLKDSSEMIRKGVRRISARYGSQGVLFLKRIVASGGKIDTENIRNEANVAKIRKILEDLEKLGIVVISYRGDKYQEWSVLRETMPLIEAEMGIRPSKALSIEIIGDDYESDTLFEEIKLIEPKEKAAS